MICIYHTIRYRGIIQNLLANWLANINGIPVHLVLQPLPLAVQWIHQHKAGVFYHLGLPTGRHLAS